MKNFSFNRFLRIARWTEQSSRREYLTVLVIMTAAFLVVFIASLSFAESLTVEQSVRQLKYAAHSCTLAFFIYYCISGSWIFSNMATRQQSITFKMLPGSDLEKFLVRMVYTVVVWMFIGLLAFTLADILRIIISLLAGATWVQSSWPLFPQAPETRWRLFVNDCSLTFCGPHPLLVMGMMFIQSVYILGGTLFNRHKQLFTTILVFVIVTVLIVVAYNNEDMLSNIRAMFTHKTRLLAALGALMLMTITNYILSYALFVRKQVVNNKLLSL